MKNHIASISFCIIICLGLTGLVGAQDTLPAKKQLKNTARINLTSPLIFGGKTFILGYERTIGKHQSFTVNFGTFSIPKLSLIGGINDTSVTLIGGSKEKGYHISADYRFYLRKENKYNSPRGVYIGPYYSLNTFERTNNWDLNTDNFQGNVTTTFNLDINTIGAQLGYQFVLWNRMAVDLILIGPGLANYKLKASIDAELEQGDKEELFEKINDALADKFPGYTFAFDDAEFKKSGNMNTTSVGFRYIIHLGFRF